MMKVAAAILLLAALLGLCAVQQVEGTDSPVVHAGFCPALPTNRIGMLCSPSITHNTCQDDSSCAEDEKCCRKDICSKECVKSMTDVILTPRYVVVLHISGTLSTEKSGFCPAVKLHCKALTFPRTCNSDKECDGVQKCCKDYCDIRCMDALTEKSGVCPKANPPRVFPLPRTCNSDSNCDGIQKCCLQSSGFGCTDPVSTGSTYAA